MSLCFLIWSDLIASKKNSLHQRWSSVMKRNAFVQVKSSVCVVAVCVGILAADSILGVETYIQTGGPLHYIDSCQLSLQWLTVQYWWMGPADREMEDKTKGKSTAGREKKAEGKKKKRKPRWGRSEGHFRSEEEELKGKFLIWVWIRLHSTPSKEHEKVKQQKLFIFEGSVSKKMSWVDDVCMDVFFVGISYF